MNGIKLLNLSKILLCIIISPMKNTYKTSHHKSFAFNSQRILLAEDDDEMRALLAQSLHKAGYEVIEFSNGTSLFYDISFSLLVDEEYDKVDLIVSDVRMPGKSGIEILENLHDIDRFPPIILITAFGDEKIHAMAERLGVAAMFDKPFDIDDLVAKVREVI